MMRVKSIWALMREDQRDRKKRALPYRDTGGSFRTGIESSHPASSAKEFEEIVKQR